jgi:hypothetical protein
MAERELAENVCRCHAMTLVDKAGGVTLGGATLAEMFNEMWGGNFDCQDCVDALRHWVVSAGYDADGVFTVVYSDYRQ